MDESELTQVVALELGIKDKELTILWGRLRARDPFFYDDVDSLYCLVEKIRKEL